MPEKVHVRIYANVERHNTASFYKRRRSVGFRFLTSAVTTHRPPPNVAMGSAHTADSLCVT